MQISLFSSSSDSVVRDEPAQTDRVSELVLSLPPLNAELKVASDQAERRFSTLSFTQIRLGNIVRGGKGSDDDGFTYRHLAQLANDRKALVSMLGPFLGYCLWLLPTAWKAHLMIRGMMKAEDEGEKQLSWVITDEHDQTVGYLSFDRIDNEDFELEDELADLRLYNIGVMLHSDFQRRRVVTEVTPHLAANAHLLPFRVDGIWIATRPGNTGVNHIARKLGFHFIKEHTSREDPLLPCFWYNTITSNLYYKRLEEFLDEVEGDEAQLVS